MNFLNQTPFEHPRSRNALQVYNLRIKPCFLTVKFCLNCFQNSKFPNMCSNFGAFPVLHWVLLAITTEVKNRMTWSIVLSNNLRWQGVLFEIQPREERRQNSYQICYLFQSEHSEFLFLSSTNCELEILKEWFWIHRTFFTHWLWVSVESTYSRIKTFTTTWNWISF